MLKIVTLLLFCCFTQSICLGQFNTVKPVIKALGLKTGNQEKGLADSTLPIVDKKLDSIAWRLTYEQFLKDFARGDLQGSNVAAPLQFYPPLRSLRYNSLFGLRHHPIENKTKLHAGVDLKARYEPVYSIADGVVKTVGYGKAEGNYIILSHDGIESVYCHLSVVICREGQNIKGGSCIAISGNTGSSTGPHLHFGIKFHGVPVDPVIYLSNIRLLNN
jgi:murein DD-endopeptidase MepM/ murein hydrolase activator NlpD